MVAAGAARAARSRIRVVKDPEVRRDELLDVAFQLCRSHGFDTMNVEEVTRAAGVAKGTFYHYFSSKDDMLEQLVRRFGESLFDHLSLAVASASGTGSDRLRELMNAAAGYKLANADLGYASFLYRAGNLALRHRLFAAWKERARQVLIPVIRDGEADGSLSVADAEGAADVVLLLWFEAADQLWARALAAPDADAFVTVMLNGAAVIYQAQERILGVPEGTYAVPIDNHIIELTRQLHARLDRKQE
jgi:AcrR family transcriptional regulator